jgi:hypothetical protein
VPRKKPPREEAAPAAAVHVVHPRGVYWLDQARAALGLAKGTLSREIRLRRLRVGVRAGKKYVLGAWLLQWLRAGEVRGHGASAPGQAPQQATG